MEVFFKIFRFLKHIFKSVYITITSDSIKKTGKYLGEKTTETTKYSAKWLNNLLASDAHKQLDGLTKNLIDDVPTAYSEKMDEKYISTGIGGSYHRHFDGTHTLWGSRKAVKDALSDDTPLEENVAWVKEFSKDMQTPRGMPLWTSTPESMDKAANVASTFGISKSWLLDAHSINTMEFIAGALSFIAVIFALKKNDARHIQMLVGNLLASGTIAGNPLSIVVALVTITVYLVKRKHKDQDQKLIQNLSKGSGLSLIFIGTSYFVGGPVWIGIISGYIAVLYFSKILKTDYDSIDKKLITEVKKFSKAEYILERAKNRGL